MAFPGNFSIPTTVLHEPQTPSTSWILPPFPVAFPICNSPKSEVCQDSASAISPRPFLLGPADTLSTQEPALSLSFPHTGSHASLAFRDPAHQAIPAAICFLPLHRCISKEKAQMEQAWPSRRGCSELRLAWPLLPWSPWLSSQVCPGPSLPPGCLDIQASPLLVYNDLLLSLIQTEAI